MFHPFLESNNHHVEFFFFRTNCKVESIRTVENEIQHQGPEKRGLVKWERTRLQKSKGGSQVRSSETGKKVHDGTNWSDW